MNANNISRIDSEQNLLNTKITASNPAVLDMLSIKGKRIYFPKKGIISQSAEARDKDINATIGIALDEDKSTMSLPCLSNLADIPQKAFAYASSYGSAELRELWRQ